MTTTELKTFYLTFGKEESNSIGNALDTIYELLQQMEKTSTNTVVDEFDIKNSIYSTKLKEVCDTLSTLYIIMDHNKGRLEK